MSFEDKINDIYEKKLQDLHTISVEQLNRYQRNELIDNDYENFILLAVLFIDINIMILKIMILKIN